MKNLTSLALLGAVLSAPLFTACSDSDDDNGTVDTGDETRPLTQEEYDDVAQSMATVVVTGNAGGEIVSLHDSASLAVGIIPLGLIFQAQGQIGGNRAGVSYEYDTECFDAQGAKLALCGAQTDRAEVSLSWSGNLDTARYDASVERTGEWKLSGVQSSTITLTGESDFELNSRFDALNRPEVRTYHLVYSGDYQGIAIDSKTRDVVAGKVVYEIDAERIVTGTQNDVDAEFHVKAELSFESKDKASLVIDGKAAYELDIKTGNVTRR